MNYHRPAAVQGLPKTTAEKAANGEWIVNGVKHCVANVPIARLYAVLVNISGAGAGVLLVPARPPASACTRMTGPGSMAFAAT